MIIKVRKEGLSREIGFFRVDLMENDMAAESWAVD
jgi:hypothetical protein